VATKNDKISNIFPLFILIGLTFLAFGTMRIGQVLTANHMDLLTFVVSLSTQQISIAELQDGKLPSIILLDLRSKKEYDIDYIGNSIFIPLKDIESGSGV
jgi:hypothetical protein